MADYSVVRVAQRPPDMAGDVGMDPEHFEIRFLRQPLELDNFAVTFERFGAGYRGRHAGTGIPCRRRSTSSPRDGQRRN